MPKYRVGVKKEEGGTRMIAFEQASYLSKLGRLRILADIALDVYPIKVKSIEFIKLSANAIFRVTDNRNKLYQLRINPSVSHGEEAAREEIQWLNHIKKTTDIRVPTPIQNKKGQYVTSCFHPAMSASLSTMKN